VRLLRLKVTPLGKDGWESPLLELGHRTTLLFAKNGSGKTPIIHSLAACLGFPIKFRDEIFSKCSSIALEAEHDGKEIVICRYLENKNSEFHATLTANDIQSEHFSEGSFSEAFFTALGLDLPRLISNTGSAAQPYVSTVLPVFYLNQGDGYTAAYKSTNPFIRDQFVEMVRFVFNLNPKHSFDVKKSLIQEKIALEAQTRKIVAAKRVYEYQSQGVDSRETNHKILKFRLLELISKIDMLRDSVDAKGSANSALNEFLKQKETQIASKRTELYELQNRVSGIDAIRNEIAGEISTLGLNEESRRVFLSFNEICASATCGLFLNSTESYGKNLLYLRDQIKDLDRNVSRAEIRIEHLTKAIEELTDERIRILEGLDAPSASGIDQLVTAVQTLTKELVDVQTEIGKIEALKEESFKLVKMEDERLLIQDRIDNLSSKGRPDLEFNRLRLKLIDLTVKWMDTLETHNVRRNIDIDLDFKFSFNGEPLDLFEGSTKIRLVLAIHAALFENYLSDPTKPFRFLILDTPKQQELHTEDLAKYLVKLEIMCEENNAQLILSSTEYDHPTGPNDKRWLPMYIGPDHPMYLGKTTDLLQ
jgi:hypothetical protein